MGSPKSSLGLGVVLAIAGALVLPARAGRAADTPRLQLTGITALPESVARLAAGIPPSRKSEQARWADAATERIVVAYRARDYNFARAWYRLQSDGTVRIHVDEGEMQVVFTGAGSVSAFFYRIGLYLPYNVFHRPTVDRALDELKHKHDLLNVYYRVKEPGNISITPLGDAVPVRVLQTYVVGRDAVGWGLDVSLSSTWGVLPGVSYERRLFWENDRFRGKVELAFPFRRYLFDEDPQFQWVHGAIQLSYRFPPLIGHLAPRFDAELYASHLDRADLQVERFYFLRNTNLVNIVFLRQPVELSVGGGVDVIRIFGLEMLPGATLPPPSPDQLSVRGLARFGARVDAGSDALRRDHRSWAALRVDVGSSDVQSWLINPSLDAQLAVRLGRHLLVARGQGLARFGDIRFWDEVPLAGSYQRVFFDNRYWVREALQLETAYRVNLWWDNFELGLFHDLSLFGDRTLPEHPAALTNAFGPSLHLLLFDLFAFDIYYGFGFSPVGLSHNLSFNLATVF